MGDHIVYSGTVISADGSSTRINVDVEGLERIVDICAPKGSSSFTPSVGQEIEIRSLKIAGRLQRVPRENRDYAVYALVPNGSVVMQRHIGTVRGDELYPARAVGVSQHGDT